MNEMRRLRLQLVGSFLLALTASALLLFAAGAAAKGIGNPSQLRQWVLESDDEWSQSRRVMRAVTGVPRSVWDLGGDTILLKRWLFSDPYNPVRISTVVFSLGGKLAAFYLGIGAALWVLWKERRAMLFILVAAGLPLLLFAITLFEPSSPERFLPVFPFAYLAFALVLDRARRYVVPSACIVILLAGTTVVNLAANTRIFAGARLTETKERIHALDSNVRPGALVTVATMADDLYALPNVNPLDKSLATSRFHVTDAVVLASRTILRWRAAYAERAQEQWAQGREVWLSERLLAPRPEARWLWVEGDDPRIGWPELPAAFSQLETDLKVQAGDDGFVRVAQSQANRDQLAKWAATEGKPTH
jgi:hypothetical protein